MQQFDVVLKVLLRSTMAQITGNRVVRWLSTELPQVQNLSVDLLGETDDGQLIHIEVQSWNEAGVPFRMLRYLALIIAIHHRIPKQVLLYIGRRPLRMDNQFTWPDGLVRFDVIDMHAIEGEPLLASAEPSDNVLAVLARLKDSRAAIRSILEKIARLPRDEAKEHYQALRILAGLRGLVDTVQQEAETVIHIDLSEDEVLGPAYVRGREEGREEGRKEGREQGREQGQHQGQLTLVRRLIERRFGTLPVSAEQKLAQFSTEDLESIGLRVLDALRLDELFH